MKTLLIMRHAKSSWKDSSLPDHDRPLNGRGKRAAPRMGELLKEKSLLPDLIISSTAERARKTAAMVAVTSGCRNPVELETNLYHGDPRLWLELLRSVPNTFSTVMIVGHNPGFEALVMFLTGQCETLPTATIAHLQIPVTEWRRLNENAGAVVVDVWRPKEL
jgi:phosphohistidine phosphatase